MLHDDNQEDFRDAGNRGLDKSGVKSFVKKRKGCPICSSGTAEIDYKDPGFLTGFISEGGRMLPSRITNVCAKHQRNLKKVIKLSRIIALLPFVYKNK